MTACPKSKGGNAPNYEGLEIATATMVMYASYIFYGQGETLIFGKVSEASVLVETVRKNKSVLINR